MMKMASELGGRILGIDPGTLRVGYAIVDPAAAPRARAPFRYVECGVIQAPAAFDIPERLHVVACGLQEVIEEFEPRMVAIEQAFHGRNAASALKLGQARGAIMLLSRQRGLAVYEYAPARIKQVVVGHGRATKAEVQQRVQLLCRLQRTPASDAADAIAAAICHGQSTGWRHFSREPGVEMISREPGVEMISREPGVKAFDVRAKESA